MRDCHPRSPQGSAYGARAHAPPLGLTIQTDPGHSLLLTYLTASPSPSPTSSPSPQYLTHQPTFSNTGYMKDIGRCSPRPIPLDTHATTLPFNDVASNLRANTSPTRILVDNPKFRQPRTTPSARDHHSAPPSVLACPSQCGAFSR